MNLMRSAILVLLVSSIGICSVHVKAYEEIAVVNELYAKPSKSNSLKDFKYEYVKEIGGYRITGYKGKLKKVTIPAKIKGKPVKELGYDAFGDCESIQSVVIPSGVTDIGFNCFISCTSLKKVTLPSTLKSIGMYAFEFCSSLTDIKIPSGVEKIGECAFKDCTSLKKVNIPSGVEVIGVATFKGCSSLESVNMSQGLKEIEFNAFKDCAKLSSLSFPASLEKFDAASLDGCISMDTINLSLQNASFRLENGAILSTDGTKLYYYPRTREGVYTIPDNVTEICSYAFSDCSKLKEVIIGSGVRSIGAWAFNRCTMLDNLTIPQNVFSILTNAFDGCTSLKSVTACEGTTYWGDYCFKDCVSLNNFTLPETSYQLGVNMFEGCKSLTSINVPSLVRSSSRAFVGCASLRSISVEKGNNNFSSRDGVLYDKSGEELLCYPQSKGNSYSIPKGVKKIGSFAFANCSNLKSVIIPNSVTSIATSSFEGCTSLKTLSVPNSVSEISYPTFYELNIKVKYKGKTYTKNNMEEIYS